MGLVVRAVSVLLVAATIASLAPGVAWAGTETPTPGALGIPVNPSASGTKLSGPLTIFYDVADVPTSTCDSGAQVTRFSEVTVLTKGNALSTFSAESSTPFCFLLVAPHVTFIQNFIADEVIPFFFPATPNAAFEFKDVSSISATHSSTATSFAISVNVIVAVH